MPTGHNKPCTVTTSLFAICAVRAHDDACVRQRPRARDEQQRTVAAAAQRSGPEWVIHRLG